MRSTDGPMRVMRSIACAALPPIALALLVGFLGVMVRGN